MAATIEILAGIAGSGKTSRLLELYRAALRESQSAGRLGQTLWLTPGARVRNALLERLCDDAMPVVFSPNVMTFRDFADRILRAGSESITPVCPTMQRVLLRRIVERLAERKELPHFGPIAGTSGFLDLVGAFISELKRSETWPEVFTAACERRTLRPADRELTAIYRDYQAALVKSEVYDSEGRFWSACQALQRGEWGPFAELSLVVVDGFTDFTHTQHDILKLLARRAGRLLVSLLDEKPLTRPDLFAKSQTVLEKFAESGPVTVTFADAGIRPRENVPPALGQVTRSLFVNPHSVQRAASAKEIEIVEAAGQAGEVKWLAARIKTLLQSGTSPDEIVVAFRDLTDYRELIDETFRDAAIPFACDGGMPLDRIPLCRALVQVLQLELEDWPFRKLLAVLDSSFFRPKWSEVAGGQAIRAAAAVLRRLRLGGGREQILQRLENACRVEGPEPADAGRGAGRLLPKFVIERALRLLQRLSRATLALRAPHDPAGWAKTVGAIFSELGFMDEPDPGSDPFAFRQPSAREIRDRIEAMLFEGARAEASFEGGPRKRSLGEFLPELADLLQQEAAGGGLLEAGRVRVLPAEQVRNLDVPHLFLAGLSERSFPRRQTDDCLYSEAQRQELNRLGLSLAHRDLRSREEMLMFYGVVTRARRSLVLTYPIVSTEGEPLSASPYVTALTDLFEKNAIPRHLEEQLDPVPPDERLLSPADARVRGMADALENRPGLLRAVCELPGSMPMVSNLLAAIEMQANRFDRHGFTRFEGLLENPDNREWLARRFSREHEFSATQLEAYAVCPFAFLLSQVVKVEPLASVAVETEHDVRGTLVHAVLAELHRQLVSEGKEQGAGPATGQQIVERFHDILKQKLGERPPASDLRQALVEIEERLLAEWGTAYGTQWEAYLAGFSGSGDPGRALLPARLETAFGRTGSGRDATGGLEPLVIGSGEQEVRIGGRIDRIDVGRIDGEPTFAIIDYKTGRTRTDTIEEIQAGRRLQLALYALATLRLGLAGADSVLWQMGYWHIKDQGFTAGLKAKKRGANGHERLETAVWDSLAATLDEVVPRLAAGIRAGKFPVVNSDRYCTGWCPYRTVCRVTQIRAVEESLEKTWTG